MFKVYQTLYTAEAEPTFFKGFLNVEESKDVVEYFMGHIVETEVSDAITSGDADEISNTVAYWRSLMEKMAENKTTTYFVDEYFTYGISSYSWQYVELKPHERTAVEDLGFLLKPNP